MSDGSAPLPGECTQMHTRLLKCTLEVEHSRAYWRHRAASETRGESPVSARFAQDHYWFGSRSLGRTTILLTNFRARFDAFPGALSTLSAWPDMSPRSQRLICHWHLQLSDPLYRRFAGEYLPERHQRTPARISHPRVVQWVGELGGGRWGTATRIQFASKLLSSAHTAGLIASKRDPRPLMWPRVDDLALAYLMYLLRGIRIEGDLLSNPYLHSVGLGGAMLEQRLKSLPGLGFRRQGDLTDCGWSQTDLAAWGQAQFEPASATAAEARA